jgi:hypothetical protein
MSSHICLKDGDLLSSFLSSPESSDEGSKNIFSGLLNYQNSFG